MGAELDLPTHCCVNPVDANWGDARAHAHAFLARQQLSGLMEIIQCVNCMRFLRPAVAAGAFGTVLGDHAMFYSGTNALFDEYAVNVSRYIDLLERTGLLDIDTPLEHIIGGHRLIPMTTPPLPRLVDWLIFTKSFRALRCLMTEIRRPIPELCAAFRAALSSAPAYPESTSDAAWVLCQLFSADDILYENGNIRQYYNFWEPAYAAMFQAAAESGVPEVCAAADLFLSSLSGPETAEMRRRYPHWQFSSLFAESAGALQLNVEL